jgi:hypothetical protein
MIVFFIIKYLFDITEEINCTRNAAESKCLEYDAQNYTHRRNDTSERSLWHYIISGAGHHTQSEVYRICILSGEGGEVERTGGKVPPVRTRQVWLPHVVTPTRIVANPPTHARDEVNSHRSGQCDAKWS